MDVVYNPIDLLTGPRYTCFRSRFCNRSYWARTSRSARSGSLLWPCTAAGAAAGAVAGVAPAGDRRAAATSVQGTSGRTGGAEAEVSLKIK